MFRKDLVPLLRGRPRTVSQIARELDIPRQEVAADLAHLLKTLRRSGVHVVVTPAQCRKCGFQFSEDKLVKPGKCPECRETWVQEAVIAIEEGDGG
jgi:predicted Zn-ribbon and HTH transcriptional regulator